MWQHKIIESITNYKSPNPHYERTIEPLKKEVLNALPNAINIHVEDMGNLRKTIDRSLMGEKVDFTINPPAFDNILLTYTLYGIKSASFLWKHSFENCKYAFVHIFCFEDKWLLSEGGILIGENGSNRIAINENNATGSRNEIKHDLEYSLKRIWVVNYLMTNCENVYREKIEPSEKLNKKRIRNGKLPSYSYHVLNVKTFGQYRDYVLGKTETPDFHNRLHFCHGHFKRFSPEHPLFGKYIGLFWWQPFIRGKNTEGFIDKDYAIAN
jgi:hypothetical protein